MTCECYRVAGWSSSVARRAHNPKVVGSNPAPATRKIKGFRFSAEAFFRKRDLFPHHCSCPQSLLPVRTPRLYKAAQKSLYALCGRHPPCAAVPPFFAGGALRQALLPQEDTGPDDRTISSRMAALTKMPWRQKTKPPDDRPAWRAAPSLLPPSTLGRTGPRHVAG